ncbi:MAG: hypothetical protein WB580_02000 [Candidatus Binataceae bacterium]
MSSERKIKANRKNAQRSTGPRTGAGKARVAFNALRHGLTAKCVLVRDEGAEEFESFRLGLLCDLSPNGKIEQALAEKIVAKLWRLRRVPVLEVALCRRGDPSEIAPKEDDSSIVATRSRNFLNLSRHETALSRSLLRDLHELQRLQAKRIGEPETPPELMHVVEVAL